MQQMKPDKYFIIDFDSTFTKVEAFDILADLCLNGNPDKRKIKKQISNITDQAMEGRISVRESMQKRLQLLKPEQKQIGALVKKLRENISDSVIRNKEFFEKNADHVYIISNGFREFIEPIVTEFGIHPSNILANDFIIDNKGHITGFDERNPLSNNQGKAELLKRLKLPGDVYVIGDGYTDYEIKQAGLANKFYAFTENVERKSVVAKADHIAPNLDEILYENKLNTAISYPKNRISVLLLENVHPAALELMKSEGYRVEVHTAGLTEDELCKKIRDVSILGIRSKTQVTAKVLKHAHRLMAIGAFCIGTNQIDVRTCQEKGIAVFNAPYSNTRSVVELAIAEMIMLVRNLPDKFAAMHSGTWNKSAKGSHEIRGKHLGIVGYGNIGAQLSVLAEAMGMKVFFYDTDEKLAIGNAIRCATLQDLLEKSEIVSLHVDGRKENANLIGAREFGWMKKGTIFLNLSRGHVVDLAALCENVKKGKIAGCGIDVFPHEPMSNEEDFMSELRGLPNTILTPHIGGSTLEAQENIAHYVPGKIISYINTGSTSKCVNFPNLDLPLLKDAHRLIHIHRNIPGILAQINKVLANNDTNIVGQYLKTNEAIGYVITDINKQYPQEVIQELRNIPDTIKFRILY